MKRSALHPFTLCLEPDPAGAGGGGGGGGITEGVVRPMATVEPDPMGGEVMDQVLSRLGLPVELKGEQPKAKPAATAAKPTPAMAAAAATATAPTAEEAAEAARRETLTEEERTAEDTEAARRAALSPEDLAAEDAEATRRAGLTDAQRAAEDAAAAAGAEPEFTAEQQAWLAEQTKTVTAELTQAKEQATTAAARVTLLEQENAALKTTPRAIAPIAPVMMLDDATKIEAHDQRLASFEKFLLANWDGTEEIPATATQAAVPAFTKDQIRARYAEVREERQTLIPEARKLMDFRQQWDGAVKQTYPELLDPKSPAYGTMQLILSQAPGLKALFPNYKMIIGDALAGEKLRLEKAKAAKAAKPAPKIAPKVPLRASPGAKPAATAARKTDTAVSVTKFRELGGDRNALVSMLNGMQLPIADK